MTAATARLIASLGTGAFPDCLLALAEEAVVHDAAALILFRGAAAPLVLADRLLPAERGYLYGDYLSGVYLLSPYHRAARDLTSARVARIKDIAPPGFTASEYHHRYFSRIGVVDMMGVLVPAPGGAVLFISLSRSAGKARFTRQDSLKLERLLPVFAAAGNRHFELAGPVAATGSRPEPARAAHAALTARESEVVNLILEGHSTAALAARLSISTETVRVHRRHIYDKLGVSSQAGLFHWFLAARRA